jgi:UDP:flavonoid glycosyltransferase YjiC (YdhE family)
MREFFTSGTVGGALGNQRIYPEIPVVVMPFQPGQANNGVCLERLGCGCRLVVLPQSFRQNPGIYMQALNRMSDMEIKSKISRLIDDPGTRRRLTAVKRLLGGYRGAETVAKILGET